MIKRLIPLTFALFATLSAFAQIPQIVNIEGDPNATSNSFVTCPVGVSAFAGTSSQALAAAAQSNDVEFLCLNDELIITHEGGQTFGDPDATSAPGISYIFYNCPPTISGVEFSDILNDPCQINPGVNVTSVQAGVDILGNANFINTGLVQTTFNAGNPTEMFFAPVTLDDFTNFSWESDGVGGPVGPCIHVNTNDAFRVVYLNQIEGLNVNTSVNGSCGASFELAGGLPEFDNSNYTNVSISLSSNPTVTANIMNGPFSHGDIVNFTVPEPGLYDVVVEDGKSCSASFSIDINACNELVTIGEDAFTLPGQQICVEVTAMDFTSISSFQYTINFDPTILMFQSANPIGLNGDLITGSPAAGTITIFWIEGLPLNGETLADGTVLYEICFQAIGNVGDVSPIDFNGNVTSIEITEGDGTGNQNIIGAIFQDGSVTITSNSMVLDFTSCSTTGNSGSFSVTATGGTAPYTVTWFEVGNVTNNGTGNIAANGETYTANGLPPGTYDVTVTDANGDIQNGTVTIADTDPLLVQINETNPTCPGGTDGSMIANINGGVSPITTLWSNGETSNVITDLAQGMYDVTVTDNNGCTATASESIFVTSIQFDTLELQHITCTGGDMSGVIRVEATGGTGSFTYNWSNGATNTDIIQNLAAGSYTVTAEDANGCIAILSITVNAPLNPVILGFDSTAVACPGDMNGTLTPVVQPGNSNVFTYEWNAAANGQTTETATGLTSGVLYSVTITDADDCTAEASYQLWSQTPLVVDFDATPPNCPGDNNGLIQLSISGAADPYQIIWENGSAFPVLPSLTCDSTYSVTVIDANGCDTIIENIYLDCPPSIEVDFSNIGAVSCNNGVPCNGSATAIASGGTAGTGVYNYTWSSGESDALAMNGSTAAQLCQGLQTVEVNDGLCSVVVDTIIPAPAPLTVDIASTFSTPVSCFGGDDGGATIVATGGTPGYSYQWTNPVVSGPTIDNVPAGDYSVLITDANNCNFAFVIEVGEPDPLVAVIDSTNSFDVGCNGSEDGQIAVSSDGGNVGPTTYTWDPNVGNTSTVNNLGIGTYTVTVTDFKGCSDEISYTVSQPDPIVAIIDTIIPPLCNGYQTVITLEDVFGGSSLSYTFNVDFGPPQFEDAAIPVLAGEHTIQVFDTLGCFSEYTIFVNEPLPLLVDLGPDTTIQLGDSLQLDPAIGSILPIDSIFWTPQVFFNCGVPDSVLCDEPWVAPLETTSYMLTVVDTNGCFGTDQIIVDIDKNRNVFIPNVFSPNGDGINDLFKIYTGVGVERVNYFRIFDRWGELLYQDDNFLPADFYIGGWDGSFKGKEMNVGVFIYIAEVVFVDGIVLLYRGDVTLLK